MTMRNLLSYRESRPLDYVYDPNCILSSARDYSRAQQQQLLEEQAGKLKDESMLNRHGTAAALHLSPKDLDTLHKSETPLPRCAQDSPVIKARYDPFEVSGVNVFKHYQSPRKTRNSLPMKVQNLTFDAVSDSMASMANDIRSSEGSKTIKARGTPDSTSSGYSSLRKSGIFTKRLQDEPAKIPHQPKIKTSSVPSLPLAMSQAREEYLVESLRSKRRVKPSIELMKLQKSFGHESSKSLREVRNKILQNQIRITETKSRESLTNKYIERKKYATREIEEKLKRLRMRHQKALQQLGNQNLNFNTDLKDFGGKPTLDTAEQSLGSIVSLSLINGYPIAAPPQDFGEESTQVESWEPDYQNEAESEGEDIIEEPKDHGIEESHATLTQEAKEEEKEEEEAEKDLSKLTSSQLNMEDQNPDFLPVAHTDKLMFPTTTDSDADAQATCINGGLLKEVESDRLKDSQNEDVDGSLDKVTPDSGVEMHTESDTNDSEMHNEELPNSFNDNNHADQTRTISTAANEDATTADRQISVETEDKSPPICSICARRISANDQEHTADANTDCTENSDWETNNIPDEHKREGFEEKSAIPSNDGSIEQILPFSLNQLQSMLTTLTASESFKLLVQTITQSEPFSAVINQLKETQTTVNQEPINSADDHKMLINNFMEDLRTGLQTPLEPTSTPQLDSPRNLSLMPASELNEIINSPCLQSSTQETIYNESKEEDWTLATGRSAAVDEQLQSHVTSVVDGMINSVVDRYVHIMSTTSDENMNQKDLDEFVDSSVMCEVTNLVVKEFEDTWIQQEAELIFRDLCDSLNISFD